MTDRLATLERMLEGRPDDTRALFGLALEYERLERWEDVVTVLTRYLAIAADEGNGYGRLARAYLQLGREDDARDAYRTGIITANRFGHPTMAGEFEDALDAM